MKDTYYFSHDYNAKDDPKCVLLIEQLGLEGYGIFWVLIEILREQPEYKYPIALLPALARRFNSTYEKVKAVVTGYGLFKIENEQFFYSESLNNRMAVLMEKRRKRSLAGKLGNQARWGQIAIESQCDGKASLSKVKESKVNNIISIEIREKNFYQKISEFKDIYHKEMLRAFYDYWTEKNPSGKKMRFEMQKTFELSKRLAYWKNNDKTPINKKDTYKGFKMLTIEEKNHVGVETKPIFIWTDENHKNYSMVRSDKEGREYFTKNGERVYL